jgi:hypothetical protein
MEFAGRQPLCPTPIIRPEMKTCIYPGCDRPVVPPHQAGGPPSAFCDREDHNALTAHQERKRLEKEEKGG